MFKLQMLMFGMVFCAAAGDGEGASGGDGAQDGAGDGEGASGGNGAGEGEGAGAAGGDAETLEAATARADKAEADLAKATQRVNVKDAKIAELQRQLSAKQGEAGQAEQALRDEVASLKAQIVEGAKRGQVERALVAAGYDPSKDADGLALAAVAGLVQWDEDLKEVVNLGAITDKAKGLFGGVFSGKSKATASAGATPAGGGGRQQAAAADDPFEAGKAAMKAIRGAK